MTAGLLQVQGRNTTAKWGTEMSKAKYYNVLFPRNYKDNDGEDRTEFIRVGVAFPLNDGKGLSLELYLPMAAGQKLIVKPGGKKDAS